MSVKEEHVTLGCLVKVDEIRSATNWTDTVPKGSAEETMRLVCDAVELNCSSELDDRQPVLRLIRDSLASDERVSGCKRGHSLWIEISSMLGFWGFLLLLQILQLLGQRCAARHEDEVAAAAAGTTVVGRNRSGGGSSGLLRCVARLRVVCEKLATPWSWPGKILGIIWSLFSVTSFAFYLHQTVEHHRFIRFCQTKVDKIYAYIDLGFNIYFLIYFVIRYIASANKAEFLVSPHSLMEVCTIGPSVSTLFSEDKHSLFNFLRAIRLAAIKEVLISFNVISSATSKSLMSLVIGMICFWSTLAGLIHLLENLDNFWYGLGAPIFNPCKALNFFNSFYLLIITASSVGYGDFYPRTTLGQLTIMICIVVASTYFLTSVPALISLYLENRRNQKETFATGIGQRHVILTGVLESSTTDAFMYEFYIDGRQPGDWSAQVKCCALHAETLPSETQWLLHGMIGRVRAIRGSCVNPRDLINVKAYSANAVIILAPLLPQDKHDSDCENYMRAMTVKLNFPDVRTIVQIHCIYNKFSYYYLTGWRNKSLYNSMWDLDTVICNDQIANGLLGLNCVAPGFSTLILNLLMCTKTEKTNVFKQYKWRTFYNFGLQAHFHCARFTRSFRGLTFKAACAIVYDRWGIMLLGVSVDQANCNSCTNIINPSCDASFVINPSIMKAFVVCKNLDDLRRFETYCNYCKNRANGVCTCDGNSANDALPKTEAVQRSVAEKLLREKHMRKNALFTNKSNNEDPTVELAGGPMGIELTRNHSFFEGKTNKRKRKASSDLKLSDNRWEDLALMPQCEGDQQQEEEFLQACTEADKRLDTADMWRFERARPVLADVSGTLHWAPNRPCRLLDIEEANEVPWRGHVVVCVLGEVAAPVGLAAVLLPLRSRLLPLRRLQDFVVLGDADGLARHEWRHVMNFRQVYFVRGSGLFTDHLVCCRIQDASAVVVLKASCLQAVHGEDEKGSWRAARHEAFGLADTDAIVCAENVRAVVIGRRGERHYRERFHLSVRLSCPDVASFFSDLKERERDISRADVTRTQAFAEGLVLSDTQLAGLVSATFHCPEVSQFLQALIQGSNQPAVDSFLGSHVGMPSELDVDRSALLSRSYAFRVGQLNIREPPLCNMFDAFNSKTIYWEELYIRSLEKFGIICLGIYQLRSKSRLVAKKRKKPSGRFVYTFPSRRTVVDVTDRVFCIIPGDNGTKVSTHEIHQQLFVGRPVSQRTESPGLANKTDEDNARLNRKYFSNLGDELLSASNWSPADMSDADEGEGEESGDEEEDDISGGLRGANQLINEGANQPDDGAFDFEVPPLAYA